MAQGTRAFASYYEITGFPATPTVSNQSGANKATTLTDSTDTTNPETFAQGETVTFSPGIKIGPTTYTQGTVIGTSNQGVVLLFGVSNYYLFTDNTIPNNTPLTIDDTGTVVACFLEGTMISTPNGQRAIETLQIGDHVDTLEGSRPIRFISKQINSVDMLTITNGLPICIKAGAFGSASPARDLYVSPDHAIFLENHLIHASVLVNGTTIVQTDLSDWKIEESIVYYNIELEEQHIINAEGLPVESYFDIIPRHSWDNYTDYLSLYGSEQPIQEIDAPRVYFERQLPTALKKKLISDKEALLAAV